MTSHGPEEQQEDTLNHPNSKLIQDFKQRNNTLDPDILESHIPTNSIVIVSDKKSLNALKHDSLLSEDELGESQYNEEIETFTPIAGINVLNRLLYVEDN